MSVLDAKTYENKCRRAAKRRGHLIRRDRTRDPLALGYGQYYLRTPDGDWTFTDVWQLGGFMGVSAEKGVFP
jgi:hypothetical protein